MSGHSVRESRSESRDLPVVFVSYSEREAGDLDFADRLLVALNLQSIQAWMYRSKSGRLRWGTEVRPACEREIERAEAVIAVISRSSLDSIYCRDEVQHALHRHASGRLRWFLPIVTTDIEPGTWPAPFGDLARRIFLRADPASSDDVARLVREVCRVLEVAHTDLPRVRHLPLHHRLKLELEPKRPDEPEHRQGIWHELEALAKECLQSYCDGRIEEALESIRLLLASFRRKYPQDFLYYPTIVEADLLVELAERQGTSLREDNLEKAQALLERIVDECRKRGLGSLPDANAFALLGNVAVKRGDPRSAREFYLKAREVGRLDDPALTYGLVLTAILAGETLREDEVDPTFWDPEAAMLLSDPEDARRLLALLAIARLSQGSLDEAQKIIRLLEPIDRSLTDLMIEIADRLCESARGARIRRPIYLAIGLLQNLVDGGVQDEHVTHRLARYRFKVGHFLDACAAFEELIRQRPRCPQYLVESAITLFALDRGPEAQKRCRDATRLDRMDKADATSGSSYHYYIGFAHRLLGEQDAATDHFRRSEWLPEYEYDRVIQGLPIPALRCS